MIKTNIGWIRKEWFKYHRPPNVTLVGPLAAPDQERAPSTARGDDECVARGATVGVQKSDDLCTAAPDDDDGSKVDDGDSLAMAHSCTASSESVDEKASEAKGVQTSGSKRKRSTDDDEL